MQLISKQVEKVHLRSLLNLLERKQEHPWIFQLLIILRNRNVFFCNETGGELIRASTGAIDNRVRDCATALGDSQLLAKLAMSDMHALDALYHKHCLIALYNSTRKFSREQDLPYHGDSSISTEAVVFAELASFIREMASDDSTAPVFKLSDLSKMYTSRLKDTDSSFQSSTHSTRLKDRLIYNIPELKAQTRGREIMLAYNKDIGEDLKITCKYNDSEALVLAKAAQIVRKQMLTKSQEKFQGSFHEGCQKEAVPSLLFTLVRMILEGPNILHQTQADHEQDRSDIALVISQLLIFNSVNRARSQGYFVRHHPNKETALAIYLGLMTHAATRKRSLVHKMHKLGLCISYDRLIQISTNMANSVCAMHNEGTVCGDHTIGPIHD